MSAPEAPDTTFDTLIVEPVPPISGTANPNGTERRAASDPDLTVITSHDVGRADAPGPNQVVLQIRKRFTELDGLRGVAALLVVVFHLRQFFIDLGAPEPLTQFLAGGYLMVDLFFALSGFVLARSMLATTTAGDVFRFSSLRARRFLPLHLTGMAIAFGCVLVTWVAQHYDFAHAPHRPAFSIEQESPWGYLSAVLLIQGFVGPHFAGYAAAWSLSIELWTNILLVLAIALVPWPKYKQVVGPIALLAGAYILATADVRAENSIGWTAFGRGLTGLGAGMVIYWVYVTGLRRGLGNPDNGAGSGTHRRLGQPARPARWPAIGATIGLIALLAAAYFARDLRELNFLEIVPIAGLLLFCLVQPSTGPTHRLMNSRVVQWLGSRSFALYALHGSTLSAVKLACRLRGLDLSNPKVCVFVIVTTLIGALLAAEIGHRFIERRWVPKKTG